MTSICRPTTCCEKFVFPRPTDQQIDAIGIADKRLDDLPNNWLNQPNASEEELKKRSLTNLYTQRPTWLANVHAELDHEFWLHTVGRKRRRTQTTRRSSHGCWRQI